MRGQSLESFIGGLVALIMCISCGDGAVTAGHFDTSLPDAVSADLGAAEDTQKPDIQPADTEADSPAASACEPGEGCWGEICDSADDCLSGICTMHLGDKVCTKTCDATCPQGWSCTLVGNGGDGQYVCMSRFSHLCLPCEDAGTCSGQSPNACVKYADGLSFCGGACDLETPCPSGYACQETETINGASSFQCVSTAGICQCSNLAIASALVTPCKSESDVGVCEGVRICEAEGLAACTAPLAQDEACNGVDDNCDGVVDENTCDDGNGCTVDTCAGADGCQHELLTQGECLDGDACTMGDHCDAGVCVGQAIDCSDNNPCTTDTCDGFGGCSHVDVVALCDDDDPCTLGDICSEGACAGAAALVCNDSNPCTDDACSEAGCAFTPNDFECDDGNACTQADTCNEGACVGGQITCDDENDCTADTCDFATGCVFVDHTAPCSDGDVCTLNDACQDGGCVAGGNTLTCDDGNPCTNDACDSTLGCIYEAHSDDCDDKNSCTTNDSCADGNCIGFGSLACDDGNACTQDGCSVASGCENIEVNGPCDDADPCTANDACVDGQCASGATVSCDDGNPCTDEACANGDCIFTANVAPCDDGNACTSDEACANGVCSAESTITCDDNNPCTTDTCHLANGCTATPNNLPCSDGALCTVGDACVEGACTSGGNTLACDDNNPCTDDICDNATGCQYESNALACDDGDACTTGDGCEGGTCLHEGVLGCDDGSVCTVDTCDDVDGCVQTPADGPCDDGSVCTLNDTCIAGNCASGTDLLACDNDNPCTVEACDADLGCQYQEDAPNDTPCGDNAKCTDGVCAFTSDPKNCLQHLAANPQAPDGTYTIDPDGVDGDEPFSAYCDMTTDQGGWTLVFRDNMDGQMSSNHIGAINPATLSSLSGATAKMSDASINAIRSATDAAISYRLDTTAFATRYFVPGACTYLHAASGEAACQRYRTDYQQGNGVDYTQCVNWGGGAGGINIWYGCGAFSGDYTNVVKTHSDESRGMACITDNPSGAVKGAAGGIVQGSAPIGCGYSQPLNMWVR